MDFIEIPNESKARRAARLLVHREAEAKRGALAEFGPDSDQYRHCSAKELAYKVALGYALDATSYAGVLSEDSEAEALVWANAYLGFARTGAFPAAA